MKDEIINMINSLKSNLDDSEIQKKIDRIKNNTRLNKIEFIQRTSPKMYWTASLNKIDQRIIKSGKMFVWICGSWGSGKSYSLYAIRNHKIMNNNYYFEIKNENELNYDTDIRRINAVDNITVNENKLKYLCQLYFDIIDFHWKNEKKLYLCSTLTFDNWLKEINRLSPENAGAIASRFSNNIDVIDLGNNDRRKNK